ncbi:MAG: hypothetical protein BWX70_02060 [Verrucomicrobia bacterium ADurb.Bin070]|nr:MAG: hypothetical protein BWX70_02060 [Verrucomicrobia bacterium ADurb.Bin070]
MHPPDLPDHAAKQFALTGRKVIRCALLRREVLMAGSEHQQVRTFNGIEMLAQVVLDQARLPA